MEITKGKDYTKVINELTKTTSKILQENNVPVSDLEWIFEQTSAKVYSNTTIKAID